MTFPRTLIGILASCVIHAALVAVFAGVAVFQGWQVARNVDFELVGIQETKVDELPLGPPPPPKGAPEKSRAGKRAHAKASHEGVAVSVADAGADAGPAPSDAGDGGARETGGDALPDGRGEPDAGDGGVRRPRDNKITGPAGSRLTALLRLDRLRTAPEAPATIAAVDGLLRHLPDRRRLLDGTGLDLYRDFDTLYLATPNPLDDTVTFLVVRHHLSDAVMMAALARGAEHAGRPLTWNSDGGRPVGVRAQAVVAPAADGGVPSYRRVDRDDRIFVLPEKGMVVMAPPAYAPLLLGARGARGSAAARTDAGVKPAELRWRDIVKRIDAEDGATPENAVLLMSATNILGSRTARQALPDSAGGVQIKGPGGLPMPAFVSLVAGVLPEPNLELTASYDQPSEAAAWAGAWPGWKQTLLGSPLLLFSGFSPLVSRATLVQDENSVVLRTSGSNDELRRLLGMLANLTGAATRR
jgi:hypothetical protein